MNYFFTYNKGDGVVANYSKGANEVSDDFIQIELSITPEEEQLLTRGYQARIKEDSLVLEKTTLIINEENRGKVEIAKGKIKDVSTLKELKDLLIQIFN